MIISRLNVQVLKQKSTFISDHRNKNMSGVFLRLEVKSSSKRILCFDSCYRRIAVRILGHLVVLLACVVLLELLGLGPA